MSASVLPSTELFIHTWINSNKPFLTLIFGLLFAILIRHIGILCRRRLPLGPFRWPLVGNTLQVPTVRPWLKFSEWAKSYGDMVYLRVAGQNITIINSAKVAHELMDKRGVLYSDRPRVVMAGELMGLDQSFVLMSLDDKWKRQKNHVTPGLSAGNIPKYASAQEKTARSLARDCLNTPENLRENVLLRMMAQMVFLTYGYEIQDSKDPLYQKQIELVHHFTDATVPGAYLVDIIPALKYLPKWMIGATFLHEAEEWKKLGHFCTDTPYDWTTKHDTVENTLDHPSIVKTVFSKYENESIAGTSIEVDLKWALMTIVSGGMDTSASLILSFFRIMILYPEIQAKAQREVDSIIGKNRLPVVRDRERMPYVECLVTELLRFGPPGPLGMPHALANDDVYDDMTILKGTVIANIWYVYAARSGYLEDGEDFSPDRYLGEDGGTRLTKYVRDVAFGFGRRYCPGHHFADASMFITIATILATCEILPEIDVDGNKIIPGTEYTSQIISFPEPFGCRIKPRSEEALVLLEECRL